MAAKTNAVREVERGEILRYLAEVNFGWITPRTLLAYLDHRALSIGTEQLDFHLNYLAEGGLILIQWEPKELGKKPCILAVKITKAGIDALDQRPAGDPGFR